MDLLPIPDSLGVHPETMPATTRSNAARPTTRSNAVRAASPVSNPVTTPSPVSNATHSWTAAEDGAISACYLAKMTLEDTCAAFPHLNSTSVAAKYRNCEYLMNPKSPNGFSHVSRQHAAVWKMISKENFTGKRNN